MGIRRIALLISDAAMILVAGCTSPGKRPRPSIVQQIQERAMTSDDIEKRLGRPESGITGSSRRTLVVYVYGRLKPKAQSTTLRVPPTTTGVRPDANADRAR